jgi:hypothetical protein
VVADAAAAWALPILSSARGKAAGARVGAGRGVAAGKGCTAAFATSRLTGSAATASSAPASTSQFKVERVSFTTAS